MSCAAAVQNETIWLQSGNYQIVPLNAKLAAHIPELMHAIHRGVPAYPDNSRPGFYDLELANGWSYIHVHDSARTVYLVAFSRN